MLHFLRQKYKWKGYVKKPELQELLRKENVQFTSTMTHSELVARLYAKVGPPQNGGPNVITHLEQLLEEEQVMEESNEDDLQERLDPSYVFDETPDPDEIERQADLDAIEEGTLDATETEAADSRKRFVGEMKKKELRSDAELRRLDQMCHGQKEGLDILSAVCLKADLKARQLSTTGTKEPLVQQLRAAIQADDSC